jgi:hypothetical protein
MRSVVGYVGVVLFEDQIVDFWEGFDMKMARSRISIW